MCVIFLFTSSRVFQLSGDHREEIKGPKSRVQRTTCTPKTCKSSHALCGRYTPQMEVVRQFVALSKFTLYWIATFHRLLTACAPILIAFILLYTWNHSLYPTLWLLCLAPSSQMWIEPLHTVPKRCFAAFYYELTLAASVSSPLFVHFWFQRCDQSQFYSVLYSALA